MKELTTQQSSDIAERQMRKEKETRLRLNAAAPDMYEALKGALRIPELWCPVGEPEDEYHGEHMALRKMFDSFNEALLKAEGKSNG